MPKPTLEITLRAVAQRHDQASHPTVWRRAWRVRKVYHFVAGDNKKELSVSLCDAGHAAHLTQNVLLLSGIFISTSIPI